MLDTDDLDDKTLEKETYRIACHVQLKQYGSFLEENHQIFSNIEYDIGKNIQLVDIMANLIDINFATSEDVTILQLVQSDNRIFSKVLASLASVCEEAQTLVKDSKVKYYHELLFYGKDLENGKIDLQNLGKLLNLLQELCGSINHAQLLIQLIVQQMVAISGKDKLVPLNNPHVYFEDLCENLGDLLVYIQTVECLLNNQSIKMAWNACKRASRTAQHSQKTFQISLDQLRAFDKLLIRIENLLLSEKIFQHTIEKCLEQRQTLIGKNTALGEEIGIYLGNVLTELEKYDLNVNRTEHWLRLNTITVFHFHLFGNADKKFTKHLLEYNKKICACTLVGNLLWYPEQFLARHIPAQLQVFDERFVQATVIQRQAQLTQRSYSLLRDTLCFCQQTATWIIKLNKTIKEGTSQLKLSNLQERCNLFMGGVHLAQEINDTVKWITNIHAAEGKPINRTTLMCIFRLNSLLKGLLYTFKLHSVSINFCITLVTQYLQFQVLTIIKNIKKNMTQDKSYKDQNLDMLAALRIAEQSLNGPPTKRRLLVVRLAMSETLPVVRHRLDQIDVLINLNHRLTTLCDVSYLYWHQMLLHVYFQSVFDSKVDMTKVMYTFYSLPDCYDPLSRSDTEKFVASMEQSFHEKLVLPLCQAIEVNLRLQTHAHLQLPAGGPFDVPVPQCRTLLTMAPIKILDHFISIKSHTENYLSKTFYNLATVVLHDWHTYGEMRRLAYFKHELETFNDFLPNQTLEQGLDVLEILRNIHVFVSKYLYNLHNQNFVEQCSNNKHLNTINIRHIANSIRMHGIGIMNTTVNFTYQFLRKKFFIFSQFMFDEHIKSRLIKDIRFFRENKTQLEQMYPFERADKFNRSIRKLGVTPTGDSFLDLFRLLISHIGNAMGYIRMIRSGGRHFCANAISFLPNLETKYDLQTEECSPSSKVCSSQLLKQIETLLEHFDEKTEYFKLLVEVFAHVFRDPSNMHLRNFYAIIPPLTINFVEHSLACRERLNKKNKVGAAFTDDGFAMGVAYILKLLEQGAELNSLHWFQSVSQKYIADRQTVAQQRIGANKDDDKLFQTLALTEKRIINYQQEFELLYYNLSSARIFFR